MRNRIISKSNIPLNERLPQLPEGEFWRVHNTVTGHTSDGDYTYEVTDRLFVELHMHTPKFLQKNLTKILGAETIEIDRYPKHPLDDQVVQVAQHIVDQRASVGERVAEVNALLGDYS